MKTRNEYMEIIRKCSYELRTHFGVTSLCLFGSVARNEQTTESDVDICVDMKPNLLLHVELKRFLEKQLGASVDVIRNHKNLNPFLKHEIEKDGIFVFS